MAEVPYSPVPQVQTQQANQVQVSNPSATAEAYGQSAALAWQRLGGEVEKVGDVFHKHALEMQTNLNETTANDSLMDAELKIGSIKEKMHSLNGKAAADYLPQAQADILKIRQDAIGGAPNPEVKHMLDNQLVRRAGFAVMDLAQYSGTQARAAVQASRSAVIQLSKENAGAVAEDDFASQVSTVEETSRKAGIDAGLDGPALEYAVRKDVSELVGSRVISKGMIDPYGAKQYLEKFKDKVAPSVYLEIETKLNQRAQIIDAKNIADDATGGDYFSNLAVKESSNDSTAQSKTSTAYGKFQFTKGTWADMVQKHPELNLTEADWRDPNPEKQLKMVKAFDKDNREALEKAGVEPTQGNRYMMHFMGEGGGPKFLKAMQKDPTQNAAEMFPEQAAANRSVFYDKQGNPRTLAQVYAVQTAGFNGPHRTDDIDTSIAYARTEAERRWPGNPQVADAAEARVRANFNKADTEEKKYQQQTYQALFAKTMALGGETPPTKIEEIIGDNPELNSAFTRLDPTRQQAILDRLAHNAKGEDYKSGPETLSRYQQLLGMSETDPAGFKNLNLITEKIPNGWIKELLEKQVKLTKGDKSVEQDNVNIGLNKALGVLRSAGYMDGLSPTSDPENYDKFVGTLVQTLRELRAGKPQNKGNDQLTDDEILKIGPKLFATEKKPTFWNRVGIGSGTYESDPKYLSAPDKAVSDALGGATIPVRAKRLYGIPPEAAVQIEKQFVEKYKKQPTLADIARAWQFTPALRNFYAPKEKE